MNHRPTNRPAKPPPAQQRGLACPRCGCRHFEVLYTRAAPSGVIRRRRSCRHCGRRITTVERPVE